MGRRCRVASIVRCSEQSRRRDGELDKPVGAALGELWCKSLHGYDGRPTGSSIIPPQGDINMKNGVRKPRSNRMGPRPPLHYDIGLTRCKVPTTSRNINLRLLERKCHDRKRSA
jgi:hypothetical protein